MNEKDLRLSINSLINNDRVVNVYESYDDYIHRRTPKKVSVVEVDNDQIAIIL